MWSSFLFFLNPASVFDISFNIYVIASVLGMNEKFVATNWFIFLEKTAQLYFQITINTTNTSDYNYSSFTSKMDGQTHIIERQTE